MTMRLVPRAGEYYQLLFDTRDSDMAQPVI